MKHMHLAGMVAVILALIACTGAVSAATLQAGSANLPTVNSLGEVPITLYSADGGISGYIITVTTSDPNVAQIVEAKLPGWIDPDYGSIIPATGGFTLKVADVTNFIAAPGNPAGGYALGSVVIEGMLKDASTDLVVTVVQMDADDGTWVTPTVTNGVIGVELTPGSIQVNTVGSTGAAITGATIVLDGATRGETTPGLLTDILPGTHQVKVSLTNYIEETREVNVEKGSTATVTITMVRAGSFRVYSRPEAGADILVNGDPLGRQTLATGTIITGYDPRKTYVIRVEKARFWGAQGSYQTSPAGTKPVALTMLPAGNEIPGYLSIDSSPRSARIFVNGEDTESETHAVIPVNPGDYTVYVTLDEYEDPTPITRSVAEGQTVELMFELKEKPPISVPEFPTIFVPIVSLLGVALVVFLLKVRKGT